MDYSSDESDDLPLPIDVWENLKNLSKISELKVSGNNGSKESTPRDNEDFRKHDELDEKTSEKKVRSQRNVTRGQKGKGQSARRQSGRKTTNRYGTRKRKEETNSDENLSGEELEKTYYQEKKAKVVNKRQKTRRKPQRKYHPIEFEDDSIDMESIKDERKEEPALPLEKTKNEISESDTDLSTTSENAVKVTEKYEDSKSENSKTPKSEFPADIPKVADRTKEKIPDSDESTDVDDITNEVTMKTDSSTKVGGRSKEISDSDESTDIDDITTDDVIIGKTSRCTSETDIDVERKTKIAGTEKMKDFQLLKSADAGHDMNDNSVHAGTDNKVCFDKKNAPESSSKASSRPDPVKHNRIISTVNDIFFNDDAVKVKPPPSKKRNITRVMIESEDDEDDVSLLDDNKLWSAK